MTTARRCSGGFAGGGTEPEPDTGTGRTADPPSGTRTLLWHVNSQSAQTYFGEPGANVIGSGPGGMAGFSSNFVKLIRSGTSNRFTTFGVLDLPPYIMVRTDLEQNDPSQIQILYPDPHGGPGSSTVSNHRINLKAGYISEGTGNESVRQIYSGTQRNKVPRTLVTINTLPNRGGWSRNDFFPDFVELRTAIWGSGLPVTSAYTLPSNSPWTSSFVVPRGHWMNQCQSFPTLPREPSIVKNVWVKRLSDTSLMNAFSRIAYQRRLESYHYMAGVEGSSYGSYNMVDRSLWHRFLTQPTTSDAASVRAFSAALCDGERPSDARKAQFCAHYAQQIAPWMKSYGIPARIISSAAAIAGSAGIADPQNLARDGGLVALLQLQGVPTT